MLAASMADAACGCHCPEQGGEENSTRAGAEFQGQGCYKGRARDWRGPEFLPGVQEEAQRGQREIQRCAGKRAIPQWQ